MSVHEEFEVGHELDRALRSVVTGLAQLMERTARQRADNDRATTEAARQDWLTHRDVARQRYSPWLRPGTVEEATPTDAAKVWAVAAAWSGMDPMAAAAEQELAQRINRAHGQHPSVFAQQGDASRHPEQPPAKRLLTMPEVLDLAQERAPFYYHAHEPAEADRDGLHDAPSTPEQQRLHADWQHFAEHGELPEASRWEAWAAHAGRGEEFDLERWRTAEGLVDEASRDRALRHLWDEGTTERATRELEEHQVAMAAAGLGELRAQVAAAEQPTWVTLMTDAGFEAASPEAIATAWRDARSKGLDGDVAAQAAAAHLAGQIQLRHGKDPNTFLLEAITDRAALEAEGRRDAEDRARRAQEETRPPATLAAAPAAAAGAGAGEVSKERVLALNVQAQEFYASQLRPGSAGERYLVDRLGEGVMQGPWALGYAPPGWTRLRDHLVRGGATDQEILAAGLGRTSSRGNVIDAFRDRVTLGVRDVQGQVVGFVARDLSGDERAPKYVNTGTTPAFVKSEHVFGLTEAPQGARLLRAEGAFDAIALSLAADGDAHGVAPMGTAMSDRQAQMIVDRAGGRGSTVWLANDNDAAGKAASEHDYFALGRHGAFTRAVALPAGDPAQAWREQPELLRTSLATMDAAPSAAELVVYQYLDAHRDELAAGDLGAERGLQETVDRVGEYASSNEDQRLLAERVEQARLELRDRAAAAHETSGQLDVESRAAAGRRDGPDVTSLDGASHRLEERAGDLDASAESIGTAAADDAPAVYDRAKEAALEDLEATAREARVASAHGFSQSTEDMLGRASTGRAQAARPNRGGAAAKTRGQALGR